MRRSHIKSNTYTAILFVLTASLQLYATTYYADALNGSDVNSGITKTTPVKTMDTAMARLTSGDTLLLSNGDYGNFGYGRSDKGKGKSGKLAASWNWRPIAEVFTDWVTIKAQPGASPRFGIISLGTLTDVNGTNISFATKGNSDLRMRFENLVIDSGVVIRGSRHVEFTNNKISNKGDTISIMNKAGVFVHNGQNITIENNEITHCGMGIQGMTRDFIIRKNNIHHNSHDGISILGGENWLIEGNNLHDLDDGAADEEQKSGAKPWNMHVDGIHMYMVNNGDPKYPIDAKNFTIRNNLFYHIEAMGVMINSNNAGGVYSDFVWENNIWGPVGGILFHLGARFDGKMVFRNNTILYAPNDIWTSIFGRIMQGQKYSFALWGIDSTNKTISYEFYNNIFATKFTIPSSYTIVKNNIYLSTKDEALDRSQLSVKALQYDSIPGNISDFIASGGIAGNLRIGSIAINAGFIGTPLIDDIYFCQRDQNTDIGAVEFGSTIIGVSKKLYAKKQPQNTLNYPSVDLLGRYTNRAFLRSSRPLHIRITTDKRSVTIGDL